MIARLVCYCNVSNLAPIEFAFGFGLSCRAIIINGRSNPSSSSYYYSNRIPPGSGQGNKPMQWYDQSSYWLSLAMVQVIVTI
jgi:hypothetical protein